MSFIIKGKILTSKKKTMFQKKKKQNVKPYKKAEKNE